MTNKELCPNAYVFKFVMLILILIELLFSEKSMYGLQSVFIIAAFPVVILSILCTVSFFMDAAKYLKE